jgi:predicted regulator of amino acid metabolism with ACT domain
LVFLLQDGTGGLEDFCSITIDGSGGLSEDILQQRLQSIMRQREELQQVEIDLRAQAIAHPQIIEVQRRFGEATKEHVVAAEKLKVVFLFLLCVHGVALLARLLGYAADGLRAMVAKKVPTFEVAL